MCWRRYILFLLMLLPCSVVMATAPSAANEQGGVDVKKVIFDHIRDSYEWHITTIGDKHISIPLPIIVYSSRTGWECFSSSVFHNTDEYKGFRIAKSGVNEGKIVEVGEDGTEHRPLLDLSLTKTVVSVLIISLLLVVIVLCTARWYKRRKPSDEAPRGFVGVMEMLITMVIDSVIKPETTVMPLLAQAHDGGSYDFKSLDYFKMLHGMDATDNHYVINGYHFITMSRAYVDGVRYADLSEALANAKGA